jgi:hypothetical protein
MLEIKDYETFQNSWEVVWCLQTFLKNTHIVFHRCFGAQKKTQRYVLHKHMCNVGEFKIASPILEVCLLLNMVDHVPLPVATPCIIKTT